MPPDEWLVKLSDFGLTKRAIGVESTTVKGTIAYMPPELMDEDNRRSDHFAGDIWCVGETAFELITGVTAFGGNVIARFKYTQNVKAFPTIELEKANASAEASAFIMSTMAASPPDRPTASQALEQAWIFEDEAEDSPLQTSLSFWPPMDNFTPTIGGTNLWSTGLGTTTGSTLAQPEPSPSTTAVSGSDLANVDESGRTMQGSPSASVSTHQTQLEQHDAALRASPHHAVMFALAEKAAKEAVVAIAEKAAQEHRSALVQDTTDKKFVESGSASSVSTTDDEPDLTSKQVSSSPSPDVHKAAAQPGDLRSSRHSGRSSSERSAGERDEVELSSPALAPTNTEGADRSSRRRPETTVLLKNGMRRPADLAIPGSETVQGLLFGEVIAERTSLPSSTKSSQHDDKAEFQSTKHNTNTEVLAGVPGMLPLPRYGDLDWQQEWRDMVNHAEARWPLYSSSSPLPEMHRLKAKLTGKAGPHPPSVFIFQFMLEEDAFNLLRPIDSPVGRFVDLCLWILYSVQSRQYESRMISDAEQSLLLPTYGAIPSWRIQHCDFGACGRTRFNPYDCRSCDGLFCVDHRDENAHECPASGAFYRNRNMSKVKEDPEATVRIRQKPPEPSTPPALGDAASVGQTSLRTSPATRMIEIYQSDDQSVTRRRPYTGHIVRHLDTTNGQLLLGREQPGSLELSEPGEVVSGIGYRSKAFGRIGFRSKVVSRRHAIIELQDDKWTIRDLGSATGTFLNTKRLSGADSPSEPHELRSGDVIRLGWDFSDHTEDSTYGAVQFRVGFKTPTHDQRPPFTARSTTRDSSRENPSSHGSKEPGQEEKQPSTPRGFRQLGRMLFR